jgi:hypothetical protein
MRAHQWSSHKLGLPDFWPHPLRTAIRVILNTGHPMYVWWGEELFCFYNDAYRQSIGSERHPSSLGRPAREGSKTSLFRTQAETLRLYRLIATIDAVPPQPRWAIRRPPGSRHRTLPALGAETIGRQPSVECMIFWSGMQLATETVVAIDTMSDETSPPSVGI